MAKISVIVPIYNVEEYVLGCLKSVAAQTFKDFECICVDDGSTDNSGKIADDFAFSDKRFTVIHQKNGGLSDARNTGMKNAKGEWIYFLDSDDYLHPQALEILFVTALKYGIGVVSCCAKNTTDKYKEIHENIDLTNCKISIIKNALKVFLTKRALKTGACFRLYKKTLIQKIPFIKGIHFEDIPFTTQLMNEIDQIVLVDAPLYYYYKNPNSIMRSNFTKEKIASYDKIIRYLAEYFKRISPDKFAFVQKYLFNQRVKMMLNQCIRKQKDKQKQLELFDHAQKVVQALYSEGLISYDGLKLKHKITLWFLLRNQTRLALKWKRLVK
ncbi:MAG: glycosyltransferase [Alphaproteobacteria bacterium]|nr:glycosyltransferase [Alphaproteobacteria bacterium]